MENFRLFDNNFYNVIFIITTFVITLFLIVWIIDSITKYFPIIRRFISYVVERMYIILVPFPVLFDLLLFKL